MSMYSSDQKYVFFSYRREDAEHLVKRIQQMSLGIICMKWDSSLLIPGVAWQLQLEQEIARSDAFVFVISPGSVASFADHSSHPTCAWELRCAMELGIDVVPVLWESPKDLHLLPTEVSNLHWVSFEDYRTSGLTDDNAFNFAWDRLMLGLNGNEAAWMDDSLEWYDKLSAWRDHDEHADFLLSEDEVRDLESFLRRTPPRCAHVLDHPEMTRFIRVNRVRWKLPRGRRH